MRARLPRSGATARHLSVYAALSTTAVTTVEVSSARLKDSATPQVLILLPLHPCIHVHFG